MEGKRKKIYANLAVDQKYDPKAFFREMVAIDTDRKEVRTDFQTSNPNAQHSFRDLIISLTPDLLVFDKSKEFDDCLVDNVTLALQQLPKVCNMLVAVALVTYMRQLITLRGANPQLIISRTQIKQFITEVFNIISKKAFGQATQDQREVHQLSKEATWILSALF